MARAPTSHEALRTDYAARSRAVLSWPEEYSSRRATQSSNPEYPLEPRPAAEQSWPGSLCEAF
jgi:hypothetical protein